MRQRAKTFKIRTRESCFFNDARIDTRYGIDLLQRRHDHFSVTQFSEHLRLHCHAGTEERNTPESASFNFRRNGVKNTDKRQWSDGCELVSADLRRKRGDGSHLGSSKSKLLQ